MIKKEHVAAKIFRDLTWHFTGKDNELYLTFDDGPTPGITPWVLALLKEYDAKATFFCVGKNVKKCPEIYSQILHEGHSVGNHSYSHMKGWFTSNKRYLHNVRKAAQLIDSNLFRPPYGKIRPKQVAGLKQDFKFIIWDVLTKDYNIKLDKEKCFKNILNRTDSGSIIVFHDTHKAEKNLKYVLPKVLKHYSDEGFVFNPIEFKQG